MPNVVITGMAGFIGFHTAIQFSADWNVYGFDNYNEYYDSSLKFARARHLQEKYDIKAHNVDLRNKGFMRILFGSTCGTR